MDRRSHRRFFTEVLGWTRNTALEEHSIVVSDISAKGCRINDPDSLCTVDDRVVLSLADLEPIAATVRWSRNAAAGLEFDDVLDNDVVLYLASLRRNTA
jgi:hypothetical protein